MTGEAVQPRSTNSVKTRVFRWAKAGFRGSLALCALALVQALVGGPRSLAGHNLPTILLVYAGGGTVIGGMTGALLPLARHAVGAMLIGALGGFTLYSGAVLSVEGPVGYRPDFPLLIGVPMGALIAFAIWRDERTGKLLRRPNAH